MSVALSQWLRIVWGGRDLVINLRHLNRFLFNQKFEYEELRVAMLLFQKGDYLFSFDLKSGYHHVDIAEPHHKYLGFAWKDKFLRLQGCPLDCALHVICLPS